MTPTIRLQGALQSALDLWTEKGWIRRLDRAFARFMLDLHPDSSAPVVLCAALLAHLEGQGHSGLPVDVLVGDTAFLLGGDAEPRLRGGAESLLGWDSEALASLRGVMAQMPPALSDWRAALQMSPLVWVVRHRPPTPDGSQPLVLDANQPLALDADQPLALDANQPLAPDANQPLVLSGSRLYLRRYWNAEQRVASQVLRRSADRLAVDEPRAREWLDRLFPPLASPPAFDWQKFACAIALRARFSVITGGPGTGKTHTAARVLALLWALDPAPERLRIALAAPTGKAAARLRQSIDAALGALQPALAEALPLRDLAGHLGAARTLHSLLGARPDTRRFQFDAAHLLDIDVLIVDEASMVHLEMMAALLEALPPQARVILLGDKDQLASVEAGAVLGDLCAGAERGRFDADTARYALAVTGQAIAPPFMADDKGLGQGQGQAQAHSPPLAQQTVMLRESRRFSGPIGQLALAVNRGDAPAAAALLHAAAGGSLFALPTPSPKDVLRLALHGRAGAEGGYRSYLAALKQRPAASPLDAPERHVHQPDEFQPIEPHPTEPYSLEPQPIKPPPDEPAAHGLQWVMRVLTAFDRFRVLCAVRDGDWGVAGLNLTIERSLVAQGLLVKRGEWYEGRPVMVTRNDPATGVFNGDIGIVLKPPALLGPLTSSVPSAGFRAYFLDGASVRSVSVSRLAHVETAFAMTVHKSQGSEFEHTALVLPPDPSRVLTRELVYTGITRARSAFTLISPRPAALAEALAQPTRRTSGLHEWLEEPR